LPSEELQSVAVLQLKTVGGLKAYTAHFTFYDFLSVLGAALEVGNLYFAQLGTVTHNPGQRRDSQFTLGDFTAANDFSFCCLNYTTYDQGS